MGYGFDLDEWVTGDELRDWHGFMSQESGWPHFLGGRSGGPNQGTDHQGWQLADQLGYAGYEHHRPTYEVYAAALDANPAKPVFSEDRFRVRDPSPYPEKDYDETLTRRGLWHSTMAGGVANIWGNLTRPDGRYVEKDWIKTWARFFDHRFLAGLARAREPAAGMALGTADGQNLIAYLEDTDSITLDLRRAASGLPVVAVDALKPYQEIDLGTFAPGIQTWTAPYRSDWALAAGELGDPAR
jgi:hypothetical protein